MLRKLRNALVSLCFAAALLSSPTAAFATHCSGYCYYGSCWCDTGYCGAYNACPPCSGNLEYVYCYGILMATDVCGCCSCA